MLVYILLIIVCTFFGFLCDKSSKKKDYTLYKICSTIPFALLFLISAIRYDVGQDYLSYFNNYQLFVSGYTINNFETGYLLFLKMLSFISLHPQLLFISTSFIINYFICKSINESSKKKWLSYLIYICGTLFFFSLNGIRQAISISIFYYSLNCIKEKKCLKYIFLNILGSLFHTSAITFIPLYFILSKKIKAKHKYIIIGITIIFAGFLLTFLSDFLAQTKYSHYISKSNYYSLGTFNVSSIINLILFIMYDLLIKKKDENDTIYSNIHFIGVIISIFLPSMPLANRFLVSFRYIEYLSVPNLLTKLFKNKSNKSLVTILVTIMYLIYFIHGIYIENGNNVLPYQTILNI